MATFLLPCWLNGRRWHAEEGRRPSHQAGQDQGYGGGDARADVAARRQQAERHLAQRLRHGHRQQQVAGLGGIQLAQPAQLLLAL